MQNYTKTLNKSKFKVTSQTKKIPGRKKEMTKNYAGGVSFKLNDWDKLNRFLILGSSEPTYYASAQKLTKKNAKNIEKLIKEDGIEVVDRVVEISVAGRAPNNDPALFVLAMVASNGNNEAKKYALNHLSQVARIGTHLFHFTEFVNDMRGWGRGLRKAFAKWYTDKEVNKLAYQVVKYQSRDGWSHRDILRKSHAIAVDDEMNKVFAWITHGVGGERKLKDDNIELTFPYTIDDVKSIDLIYAFELAKRVGNEDGIVKLIKEYNLPREAIPTQFLGKKVYEALLPTMPMTALIRNLGTLGKVGILEQGNFDAINMVVDKITNVEALAKARVHPIALLMALKTYGQGQGFRGSNVWKVVPQVVDALDAAFYMAFKNVEPTGKRILLALDVSGSMNSPLQNAPFLTCRAGSSAMAMVTMNVEKNWAIIGFTGGNGGGWGRSAQSLQDVMELKISPSMRLDDVENYTNRLPFAGTDCALPAIWAKHNNKDFDAIVVYTDSETWAGRIQPVQAMEQYRNKVGHDVKMIVVGMASNGFTIADPEDKSMLDCVGFDSNAPSIINDFIADKF